MQNSNETPVYQIMPEHCGFSLRNLSASVSEGCAKFWAKRGMNNRGGETGHAWAKEQKFYHDRRKRLKAEKEKRAKKK